MAPIAYEEEEEKDMVANLRVGFKKSQRKRLSESITIISSHSKKPCSEPLYPKLVLVIAPTLTPSTNAAGSNPESN